MAPPRDRPSRSYDDPVLAQNQDRLESVLNALRDQGVLLAQLQEKERQRASERPPRGPTIHLGDPKWWIALITGLAGAGILGGTIVSTSKDPLPVPADIQIREELVKSISERQKTCQENVLELQQVVWGMRDKNLAAFEKLGVRFRLPEGTTDRGVVEFTERMKIDRRTVYDAQSPYPSLKNQPK